MSQRDVYLVGHKRPAWKHMPHDYGPHFFTTKEDAKREREVLQRHGFTNVIIKKRNRK